MKDVSPLVQNLEKIVLGVCALVLVLVGVYFFVFSPFAVERGGRSVSVVEFESQLEEEIDRLERALQEASVPERRIAEFAEVFTRSFNAAITGVGDALTVLMLPGLPTDLVPEDARGGAGQYALPSPPPASSLAAKQGFALLNPADIENDSTRIAVERLIDNPAPPDYRYVSVSGTFDLPAWDEALARANVPEGWRRDRRGVANVSLVRQTYDPLNERWGNTTRIDPLPTQLFFGEETTYTREMAEQFVDRIRRGQRRIARPYLPPSPRIDGGIAWISPDVDPLSLDAAALVELNRINATLKSNRAEIHDLAIRLDLDQLPPPPPPADATPTAVGFGEDRRNARDRRGTGAVETNDPLLNRLQELQRENIDLIDDRAQLLGIEPDPTVIRGEQTETEEAADGPPSDPWFENAVRLWAHDVTVEPGGVYRYKLIVGVVNPLFHEDRLSPVQRDENLNRLVLYPDDITLDASPWSEPVAVDAEAEFFLVGGDANLDLAEVEVWQPYAGRWVSEGFRPRPGNEIGGPVTTNEGIELDLTLDALLVDVLEGGTARDRGVSMLFIEPANDRLQLRSVQADRTSEAYRLRRLQLEAQRELDRNPDTP